MIETERDLHEAIELEAERREGKRLPRYARPRPPEAQLMRELRRRFKPEVVALSDYRAIW